ncbi:hypothetical protein AE03_02849 [Klebsiella aerogenes MGH 77]|nr:hypothetical protein AE03_02849 [Klebsiella aerogenes MGH 77]
MAKTLFGRRALLIPLLKFLVRIISKRPGQLMTLFANNAILRSGNCELRFPCNNDLTDPLMKEFYRLFLLFFLLIAGVPAFAAETSENVRAIVSGIVTYTRWPNLSGPPKLCVFSTSRYIRSLAQEAPENLPYQPVIVRNSQEALKASCDGLYFGSETPDQQSALTKKYGSRPLLLIAEQNTDCSFGSAFCLLINDDRVRFSVNLDVLTHSGVRVNPDVLMLARKKSHE